MIKTIEKKKKQKQQTIKSIFQAVDRDMTSSVGRMLEWRAWELL